MCDKNEEITLIWSLAFCCKLSVIIIILILKKENETKMFASFLVISQNVCFSRSFRYFSIPTKVRRFCVGKKVSLHE